MPTSDADTTGDATVTRADQAATSHAILEGNPRDTYPHAVNAKLVERLAQLEARHSSGIAKRAGAFVQIHTEPEFGWHIAKTFAGARVPFPVTVIGRDHWLFSAYLMHLDPVAYR